MAYTTLTRATKTAGGRWKRRGAHSTWIAWKPDSGTMPIGGWPVVYVKHGGARNNPEDLELGTNQTFLDLVNKTGSPALTNACVIVSYDTEPGGFHTDYTTGNYGEEKDCLFFPDNIYEDMAAIASLRSMLSDTSLALLGGSDVITTSPSLSLAYGDSSGAWEQMLAQLMGDGSMPYPTSSTGVARGDATYQRRHSHLCDFVYGFESQVEISNFCTAIVPTASGWTVSGAHSSGVSSIAITGGSGNFYQGNRFKFNGTGQQYVITADASGSPLSIYPTLQSGLSGGEAITTESINGETYKEYGWAGSYLFSASSGYLWNTFPMARKRQADVTRYVTADNPRCKQINWFLATPATNALVTYDTTGVAASSFLNHIANGSVEPSFTDLHSEHGPMYLAYLLESLGCTNLRFHLGNTTSVPTEGTYVKRYLGYTVRDELRTFLLARGW